MFLPLVCRGSVFGPRFAMHYLEFFFVLQSSQWGTESKMPYFSVLFYYCSVAVPHGAMDWSEVCNCDSS